MVKKFIDGYKVFGNILREKISSDGIYQYQLAYKLNIHPKTIERILKGSRKTGIVEFIEIAKVLSDGDEMKFYHLIMEWVTELTHESGIELKPSKEAKFNPCNTTLISAYEIADNLADGDDKKFHQIIEDWFNRIKKTLDDCQIFDINSI